MTVGKPHPLGGDAPKEIPLPRAPLELVVAQVRFPSILALSKGENIIGFQEAVRERYPSLSQEHLHQIGPQPKADAQISSESIWRFSSADENWRLSLGINFMALETTSYDSRDDFCQRFYEVCEALEQHAKPKVMSRLGLRYVDRIVSPEIDKIEELVRRDVVEVFTSEVGQAANHILTTIVAEVDEGNLQARWGYLPPNATIDPVLSPRIGAKSWILDLDVFSDQKKEFDSEECTNLIRSYALRAYTVFRWMVTEQFILTYGGKIDDA